jgi:FAD-dependent urate hydroxylase
VPATFENEPGTMYLRLGRRCFLGHVTGPDGQTWWFANPPSDRELARDELAAMPEAAWRRRLLELFDGDELPAAELIQGSPHVFAAWNTYGLPSVPRWSRDSMVIIGDAAHATSPAAGQGASLAVEDAVTLALALRDEPDIEGAFRHYEQARRERVEKVVELGKRNGTGKAPGPVTRFVRDRLVLPMAVARFSRQRSHPEAWLFDHHATWEAVTSSTPRCPRDTGPRRWSPSDDVRRREPATVRCQTGDGRSWCRRSSISRTCPPSDWSRPRLRRLSPG